MKSPFLGCFLACSGTLALLLLGGCASTVTSGENGGGDSTSSTGGEGGAGGATASGGGTASGGSTASGGGGSSCDDPPSPAVFEVGTGETCFARLTPNQVVTVLQGPQGGFHLWFALGCGDCGDTAVVRFGIKDPATSDYFPDSSPQKVVAPLDPAGWHQIAGFTAFLPGVPWDETTQLPKGSHVILSGAILDDAGQPLHEQEIEVELGDVESWYPPCSAEPGCGAPGGLPCCNG